MLNILELVYGGNPTPDTNPIHIFNKELDVYEHAEFEKDNGDFYQIIKVNDNKVLYHFQKQTATIISKKKEGNWWLRHDEFTRFFENKPDIFYEKIHDRLIHGYLVKKLVVQKCAYAMIIDKKIPDYEKITEVFTI